MLKLTCTLVKLCGRLVHISATRYLRMEYTGQVEVLVTAMSNVVDFLNWSVLEALMRTSIVSLVEISLHVVEGSKAGLVGVVNSLARRNP